MRPGSQTLHVNGMSSAKCCLRLESGNAQPQRGFPNVLQYLCKSLLAAKSSTGAGLRAAGRVRLVWWGISGVKDARKNVLIADASASAEPNTGMKQKGDKLKAGLKQAESNSGTKPKQYSSKARANAKHDESRSGTTCPPI